MALLNTIEFLFRFLAPGVKQEAAATAKAMQDVSGSTKLAAEHAKVARKDFVQVAGAFTALYVARGVASATGQLALAADSTAEAMAKVNVVTLGGTENLTQLKVAMIDAAKTTGAALNDVAQATANLLAEGFTPTQIEPVIKPLTLAATAFGLTSDQIRELTQKIVLMGEPLAMVPERLSKMQRLARATSLNMKEFTDIIIAAGANARTAGVGIDDLMVAAGLMRRSFGSAKVEGTALRQMLTELLTPKKMLALQDQFQIKTIDEQTNSLRPLTDIMLDLANVTGDGAASVAKLNAIFGEKTGRAFHASIVALKGGIQGANGEIVKGADAVAYFNNLVKQGGDEITPSFAVATATLSSQLKILIEAGGRLIAAVFGPMSSILTTLVGWFSKAVGYAESLARQFTFIPLVTAGFGLLLGAVGLVSFGLLTLVSFGQLAMFAFKFLTNAVRSLGTMAYTTTGGLTNMEIVLSGIPILAMEASLGVRMLTQAFRLLKLAIPFGILMLLADLVVPALLKFFGVDIGTASGAADTVKQTENLRLQATESLAKGLNKQAELVTNFGKIVDEFTGAAVTKYPAFDPETPRKMQTALEAAAKVDKSLPLDSIAILSDTVTNAFDTWRKGMTLTESETQETIRALQITAGIQAKMVELGVPGAKQALKEATDTLDQFRIKFSEQNILLTKDLDELKKGPAATVARLGTKETPAVGRRETEARVRAAAAERFKADVVQTPQQIAKLRATNMEVTNVNFSSGIILRVGDRDIGAVIDTTRQRGNVIDQVGAK